MSTEITREVRVVTKLSDIVLANLLLFHRTPGTIAFFIWVALGYIGMGLYREGISQPLPALSALAAEGLLVGAVVVVTLFAVSLAVLVVTAPRRPGVLGEHLFLLEEEGLREITRTNDSLQKWLGIRAIRKTKHFALVHISDYLFHVIPRRSFVRGEDYEDFVGELSRRRDLASQAAE